MMIYEVHDEDGPLRRFQTRAEAKAWLIDGMTLVVLPKPAKVDWLAVLGDAPW